MEIIRSYSEVISLPTFEERFQYLRLKGVVGRSTFGYDRYLNQILYTSPEWRAFRRKIILRDNGCDLACEDRKAGSRITVHHINPITVEDVLNRDPKVFDPENVITTADITHKAIHYGNEDLLMKNPVERRPNDTCPWRQ
jgi:hypothetical protein